MKELLNYFVNDIIDLVKCGASLFTTFFSIKALLWGADEANLFFGFILFFGCLALSAFILSTVSSETRVDVHQIQKNQLERRLYKNMSSPTYGYICPCCGHPAGMKVDAADHKYRCRNCRYIW